LPRGSPEPRQVLVLVILILLLVFLFLVLVIVPSRTTNVTLKIDPGYPRNDDFKPRPDFRDDPRIAAAVEKLLGKDKR